MDARLLRGGGIGRYVRELAGCWLREEEVEEIRFLGDPAELEPWLEDRPGAAKARVVPWTDPVYSLRAQLRWSRRGGEWTDGCDVAFFPHWDAPARASGPPRLLAIHDLTHFVEPGGFPAWKRAFGRLLLRRAIRTAWGVVTVSRASRDDIVRAFPQVEPRLRVIPNGVSHDVFRPLGERERIGASARWSAYRPFLLVVGPIKPHKGVGTALRALGALRGLKPELRLVQVGPPEIRDPEVRKILRDPHLERRFAQIGVLDDEQLNEVYGVSECLLHAARKEGFGLPPLEAMASGTPVLASDRSSLPEVTGHGARLLDPDDPEAWARAILEVTESPQRRREWIRRGRKRAANFSWERSAAATLEALREAAGTRETASGPSPTATEREADPGVERGASLEAGS